MVDGQHGNIESFFLAIMLVFTKNSSFFLDLIRAASAQAVLWGHVNSFYGIVPLPGFCFQNLAVVIFFILSGLLITKSLVKAYLKNNFLMYFSDRFLRIYITLIPCLIFITLIDSIHIYYYQIHYKYNEAINLRTFIGNIIMLQDYPIDFLITSYGSGRPLWTLAIEWWLYLSAGCLVYILKNYKVLAIKGKAFILVLFLVVSIVPVHNLCVGHSCFTLFWLLGCIIYYFLSKNYRDIKVQWYTAIASIAFSSLIFFVFRLRYEYDLRVGIAVGFLLYSYLAYAQQSASYYSAKLNKVVSFMASFSFTLYLTHYSIVDFLDIYKNSIDKYMLAIIAVVLSNIMAILIYFFGEKHYKKLQNKIRIFISSTKKINCLSDVLKNDVSNSHST